MATDFNRLVNQAAVTAEGVAAVWTRDGVIYGRPKVIPPINDFNRDGTGEEYAVNVWGATIGILTAIANDMLPRDNIEVNGMNYLILTIDHDQTGWSTLSVERVL